MPSSTALRFSYERECFTKPRIHGFSYSSRPALAKEPALGYSGAAVAACLSVSMIQSGCLPFCERDTVRLPGFLCGIDKQVARLPSSLWGRYRGGCVTVWLSIGVIQADSLTACLSMMIHEDF